MKRLLVLIAVTSPLASLAPGGREALFPDPINVKVPHISTDKSVNYDYDIVYVRRRPRRATRCTSGSAPTSRSR